MYDAGDLVIIHIGNHTYKGRIEGFIEKDAVPAYRVRSLVDNNVWVVKEVDIDKRIKTSIPPPPKVPSIKFRSISDIPPKKKSLPPPPPNRNS